MGDDTRFNSETWPRYRSKFRVKAWCIQLEGAKPTDTIAVTIAGRKIPTHAGDYIVELDDGRLEHWTKDKLERELELEVTDGRELHLEIVP